MQRVFVALKGIANDIAIGLIAATVVAAWWAAWLWSGNHIPEVDRIWISISTNYILWHEFPFPISRLWDIPAAFVWAIIIKLALKGGKRKYVIGASKMLFSLFVPCATLILLTTTTVTRADITGLSIYLPLFGTFMDGAMSFFIYQLVVRTGFMHEIKNLLDFSPYLLANALFGLSWGLIAAPLLGGVVSLYIALVVFITASVGMILGLALLLLLFAINR